MAKKIKCEFCGADLTALKFRVDYQLYAWCDDPENPMSMNKIAKTAHQKCFDRFLALNQHRERN